jgi:drug/metabolite transporter (DMT)-like permease
MPQTKKGILLGAAAVLFWSTSSACIVFSGQKVGPWQVLAVACGLGAIAQIIHCLAAKVPLRNLFAPPPRLFALLLLGFVAYEFLYAAALITAPAEQKLSVNLVHYLWPSLIVLFAVFLVPGTRMTPRLGLALLLAFAGVLMANFKGARELLAGQSHLSLLPYALALGAAVAWAAYSAFLSRYRAWAHPYPTAPLGLLLTSLICAIVCLATHSWTTMDAPTALALFFMGLGPQGAGYLLWELAIHRAPASALGLLASATPLLSTLWLLLIYRFLGSQNAPPDYALLLLAALTIGLAVILGAETRPAAPLPDTEKRQS